MRSVTSRHNPVVSRFRALADEADPRGARVLLDGAHLVQEAREAGTAFEIVCVASSRLSRPTEEGSIAMALSQAGVEVVDVPDAIFQALSPVRSPSGIAAIATRTPSNSSRMCARPDAFIALAIDMQDPGNVGALVRTAEAGGATGVIVAGASAAPFSWKAIRGSMGSALRLPLVGGMTTAAALACLRDAGVRTVAAVPRGGMAPDAIDWVGRVALLLGGEGPGLSPDVAESCGQRVSIPMAGHVESLNVAAAAAILIYEARKQRA